MDILENWPEMQIAVMVGLIEAAVNARSAAWVIARPKPHSGSTGNASRQSTARQTGGRLRD
jgi:hypothetical protein